jgi:polar amino acid transport system permease protein
VSQFFDVLLGVPVTLAVSAVALVIGLVLGLPLALLHRSRFWIVRNAVRLLVDVLRAMPPIVLLFILFFALAQAGFAIDAFTAGALGLGLVSAAYLCEVYRSGLISVPGHQWEASYALGLTARQGFTAVVAPQAVRIVLPGVATWGISLLKESAAVSIIGLSDVAFRTFAAAQNDFGGIGIFAVAALVYIALSVPIGLLARWADARIRKAVVVA